MHAASGVRHECAIGLGILAAGLFLAVPLVFIFIQAFQMGIAPVLENLVHPEMIHAVALTVFIALITVPVNMIFGVMLAWAVTRFSFPGKTVLLSCIDIPFAVSPVVAGLIYLLWYGANGPLAPWLDTAQVQILFAWPGMVLVRRRAARAACAGHAFFAPSSPPRLISDRTQNTNEH